MFLFEVREICSFIEKVIIGNIKTAKGLLKRLRINTIQPDIFRTSFKLCKHYSGIVVSQALLFFAFIFSVKIYPLTKEVIIYKTTRTKMLSKGFYLIIRRIYSKSICLVNYHGYNIHKRIVIVKRNLSKKEDGIPPPAKAGGLLPCFL